MESTTGVILSGGLSTRFSGFNKSFLFINGKRIIEHIYLLFENLFDEIIIVSNDPVLYLDFDTKIISDFFSVRSSLTGIHTGLSAAKNNNIFITACDTPFLEKELIKTIINYKTKNFDIVVPKTANGFEPLCALYSKSSLHNIENNLKNGNYKIMSCFKNNKIKSIPETILRDKDPHLLSFFNINNKDDFNRAKTLSKNLF